MFSFHGCYITDPCPERYIVDRVRGAAEWVPASKEGIQAAQSRESGQDHAAEGPHRPLLQVPMVPRKYTLSFLVQLSQSLRIRAMVNQQKPIIRAIFLPMIYEASMTMISTNLWDLLPVTTEILKPTFELYKKLYILKRKPTQEHYFL